jgi:GAF domain-containing protein
MDGYGEFELPTWAALPARPHPEFDEVARRLARLLSVPMAFVVLVTKGGLVFPGAVGTPPHWDGLRSLPLGRSPSQRVAGTGRPLLIRDVREDALLHGNPTLPAMTAVAYAGAALPDAQGRPLGVLCAVDVEPRDWSPAELALLERLAAECSLRLQVHTLELAQREARMAAERAAAQAQRAAAAARAAFQEAEAGADRARLVARTSTALLDVTSLDDVLGTVDRLVRSPLGAAGAMLGVTQPGSRLLQAHPAGPAEGTRRRVVELDLDDAHPLAVAVRERRLVTAGGSDTTGPAAPGPPPGSAGESVLAVPLQLGQHSSSGALLLSWAGRRNLDPALRTVVTDLGRHLGYALDQVLLAEARAGLGQVEPVVTPES